MPASGEVIRLMNYVDDIVTTVRRIHANLLLIPDDEKKRLAEYMRKANSEYLAVIERLEKGDKS